LVTYRRAYVNRGGRDSGHQNGVQGSCVGPLMARISNAERSFAGYDEGGITIEAA
jgi:hypothetical protein